MTNDWELIYQQGVVCQSSATMITIIPPYPLGVPPAHCVCPSRPLVPSAVWAKIHFLGVLDLIPPPPSPPIPWVLGSDYMHYKHSLGLQEAWNAQRVPRPPQELERGV